MFLFLILCGIPYNTIIIDKFDIIEINHIYDDNGILILNQVICWDFIYDNDEKIYIKRVEAYSLFSMMDNGAIKKFDITYIDINFYKKSILCLHKNKLRKIEGKELIETWIQFDPEQIDAKNWGTANRRGFYQK